MAKTQSMDTSGLDQFGWATLIVAYFGIAVEWITNNANSMIVGISGIMGIVFLYYKIKIITLDYKERISKKNEQ